MINLEDALKVLKLLLAVLPGLLRLHLSGLVDAVDKVDLQCLSQPACEIRYQLGVTPGRYAGHPGWKWLRVPLGPYQSHCRFHQAESKDTGLLFSFSYQVSETWIAP